VARIRRRCVGYCVDKLIDAIRHNLHLPNYVSEVKGKAARADGWPAAYIPQQDIHELTRHSYIALVAAYSGFDCFDIIDAQTIVIHGSLLK
jgi:hypothetical protein